MSQFKTHLILDDTEGTTMRLAKPFRYQSDLLEGMVIEVPKGFITDFASIPAFFTRIIPKNGRYDWAALIHDYLYTRQSLPDPTGNPRPVTKALADHIFLEAMQARNVHPIIAWVMYRAVHRWGQKAWDDHTRELEAKAPRCTPL